MKVAAPLLAFSIGSLNAGQATGKDKAGSAIVAPVFEHGEGRGSIGCVMVNGPVFLSEEEALAVIKTALEKRGLTGFGSPKEYPEITIAQRLTKEHWISTKPKELGTYLDEFLKLANAMRADRI
ncbi:MAG: hypothetical protein M5R36_15785 [Deltaproteobacteria bacterium]|nr:hypothetical protein [Deltaproteobacteria bacterium]